MVMGETTLSGMKAIQDHCRAINLPSSEATVLQMIRESGFPARKLGGIWVADTEMIGKWVKIFTSGEKAAATSSKKKKQNGR
jgi:hypothetical protein